MVLWFPEEISPVEDAVNQLGSCVAATSMGGSILPKLLHEIERRWVPLGPHFPPNSVMAFLKKLPLAVTAVEGVSHASPVCSCHFTSWHSAAAISPNTLCDSGGQSCFMSTIFTKIFTTEKPGSLLPNKGGCSWKSGWKEMKFLVLKQKSMQLPWLFHDFNNTEKIWLIHTAMLELVHQPPAHFLTI